MKRALKWLLVPAVVMAMASAEVAEAPDVGIARLRAEIARHDELYHRQAAPELGDADYDALKRRLAALERAHPEAAQRVPAGREIGDDRSGLWPTVRHGARMLSLEKAYAEADVRAFAARVQKAAGGAAVAFAVEPKYDGLAIGVTYVRGRFLRAVTRGDGSEGDDVSRHVRRIADVVPELRAGAAVPESIEVRGEIFVPWAEWRRVNAEREAAGERGFANPRALAAATLRQVDPALVAERGLRAVFFGVGAGGADAVLPATQSELRARFDAWGLRGPEGAVRVEAVEQLMPAIAALGRARERQAFPTDGVVLKVDSRELQAQLGDGEAAPRWALAYKFAAERAETRVRAIAVQVGRTGVLTPVAELEPVALGGTTVARATLHNREEIARRDVRVGDVVVVERAGDIIPAVVAVNRARRPADAVPYAFPAACPECGAAVEVRAGEAAVRCPAAACPAQVRRRIEHFVAREAVDVAGLGPATIAALVRAGAVADVADLYRLSLAQLTREGRMAARNAEKLAAALERSRSAELWRVIHGLGVPGVGAVAAKELARRHGSLAAWAEAEPRVTERARALLAVGVTPRGAEADAAATAMNVTATKQTAPAGAGALRGKTLVITGTLPTLTRAEATARIEAAGGRTATSVSRLTSYVVAGAEPGAKREQAIELGVPVIDEAELRRLLGGD
jgi:DNA ligase (NAD+)